ncbi:hypothetical protein GCM10025855_27280 [Shewanella glacialipiscicola]|uniref:HTH lysR-type domain-containing protein n=1 Tax=Shewanella glacialipiscicola TaxID=614069 RepID=A0ABQ6J7D6_9GAMM|nr:hypothetical protein GCM10025855_27280 [Shewanella glacialipiscicola]
MVIFHTLVTSGSFTQAAAKLKTSTSYVSKQIGALEAELNLLLVQRTTRTLVLTDAGQQFAHYCEQVFEATQNADAMMLDARDDISGTIRLGCSQSFGTLHIIPALEVLQQKYPELRFELSLFDHKADMLEEGLDLWITNHEQLHESYIAQHLAETNFVVVASPIIYSSTACRTIHRSWLNIIVLSIKVKAVIMIAGALLKMTLSKPCRWRGITVLI